MFDRKNQAQEGEETNDSHRNDKILFYCLFAGHGICVTAFFMAPL